MTAEATPVSVNGNYATHPQSNPYTGELNVAPVVNGTPGSSHFGPQHNGAASTQSAEQPKSNVSKDEVGWYFVEQYYTTLSQTPEKLYLFYSRRSQFVFGMESEKVTVACGGKAINERIKELDFQDCKVRVLNVDSQSSFNNILVTVIGEISNKSEPSRKFVQSFVLAEQPNGYYVLNDIFRYLNDDDDEEVPADEEAKQQPVQPASPAAPTGVEPTPQPVTQERNVSSLEAAQEVDEKLQETVGGTGEAKNETAPPAEQEALAQKSAPTSVAPQTEQSREPLEPQQSQPLQTEEPREPEHTPAEPAKATTPKLEKQASAGPKAPVSWASIARNSKSPAVAVPVVPVTPAVKPVSASSPAPPANATVSTTISTAAPVADSTPSPAAPLTTTSTPAQATASSESASQTAQNNAVPAEDGSVPPVSNGSEWQTAGSEHRQRQQKPIMVSSEGEHNTLAYIKNVTEKISPSALKQTLQRYGPLKDFDVNRNKNCAFVEFAEPAGYKAAVAANPHQIGTEQLNVESRRFRTFPPGTYPNRGGSRGRGSRFPGKDTGRYATRGRGGGVPPKGRGQPQTAS